jgi:ABC-type Fe3+ transport system permease subunit
VAFWVKASEAGPLDWAAAWSSRVVALAAGSAVTALLTAVVVVGIGVLLCEALERRPERERFFWLGGYGLAALMSPYIVVRGWINLWGREGWLRVAMGLGGDERFTLFSPGGSLAMHLLLWLPTGVVILWAARTGLAEKHDDFMRLYRPGRRGALVTYYRAKYLVGTCVTGLYTLITVFWSYEVPSILSQPSLAMEVMAAFGSFYDYGAAAALVLPPLAATLVLGVIAFPLLRGEGLIWRRASGGRKPHLWACVALALPLILGLGMCLAGLLLRLSRPGEIGPALLLARPDFLNTLMVASGAGLLLAVVGAVAGLGWRLSEGGAWKRLGLVVAVGALAVPPVVGGIGWVHLYGTAALAGAPRNILRLVLVDGVLLLPLGLLLGYVATASWTQAWNRELAQFGRETEGGKMAGRLFAGRWVLLGAVGGALAAREVAAGLLNYPPGGSTLAITIETMLHFDQPTALSVLSLAQLILVAGFWSCGLIGYRYLSTRWI